MLWAVWYDQTYLIMKKNITPNYPYFRSSHYYLQATVYAVMMNWNISTSISHLESPTVAESALSFTLTIIWSNPIAISVFYAQNIQCLISKIVIFSVWVGKTWKYVFFKRHWRYLNVCNVFPNLIEPLFDLTKKYEAKS